jgi:hypothetical protein
MFKNVFSKRSLADFQCSSIVTDILKSTPISSNLSSEAVAQSLTSFTCMGSCAAAAEVLALSAARYAASYHFRSRYFLIRSDRDIWILLGS